MIDSRPVDDKGERSIWMVLLSQQIAGHMPLVPHVEIYTKSDSTRSLYHAEPPVPQVEINTKSDTTCC